MGDVHGVELAQGRIRYFELRSGRPVVFVHGLLVNAELWRAVLPGVAGAGFRCLAPDWPLGSHQRPMSADADLTPPGQAKLIADFLVALDLRDVTVVGNDTGGALTQILMAGPERIAKVVLTPSDSFERLLDVVAGGRPAAAVPTLPSPHVRRLAQRPIQRAHRTTWTVA
jgi:pimeloyl-ACP methyl ester carboxylesterase